MDKAKRDKVEGDIPGGPLSVEEKIKLARMAAIQAIRLLKRARGIVTQHNLLSTASEAELRATVGRHIEWWDKDIVPFLWDEQGEERFPEIPWK